MLTINIKILKNFDLDSKILFQNTKIFCRKYNNLILNLKG